MDTLHQRLLKSFDLLRDRGAVHTQTQFADIIGKSQSQINGAFKDAPKRCTLGLMKTIADAFPDILNRDYLLTGEGDIAAPDRTMKRHFDAKACAGFMNDVGVAEVGQMRPAIPGMKDYDFTIEARGDSMLPRIESGDLLVCRRSMDRANPPIGKICVIDGKDGVVVKVIASANEDGITLHSLNPDPTYVDYKIDNIDVIDIAEVVGLVRKF